MSVEISGSCLSYLFYEQVKSSSDSEGFLVGRVLSIVSDVISDHSTNDVSRKTIFVINKIIPCYRPGLWYDRKALILKESLEHLLGNSKPEEIMGWYRTRRESSLMLSLREKILTSHLQQYFSSQNFLFLLMTSNNNLSGNKLVKCLHTYEFQFFDLHPNKTFTPLPVDVNNLGGIANPEYRLVSNSITSYRDIQLQTTQNKDDKVVTGSSVDAVDSICERLNNKAKKLEKLLIESEKKLYSETKRLDSLKKQLNAVRELNSAKIMSRALSSRLTQEVGNEIGVSKEDPLIDLSDDCPVQQPSCRYNAYQVSALPSFVSNLRPVSPCLLTSPIPENLNLGGSIFTSDILTESSI